MSVIDKKIMHSYLFIPEAYRSIMIDDFQLEIVAAVRNRGYPSSTIKEIADYLNINTDRASRNLNQLHRIGYLDRRKTCVDGRFKYFYSYACGPSNN